jgi:hypothetical protein
MIEQSTREYEKSRKPPDRISVADIPSFPGSSPVLFLHNEDTRMSFAVSRAPSPPPDIRDFYRARLIATGWKPMFDRLSRVAIYLKGTDLCCVGVDNSVLGGESRITLLHKQHGMQ